MELSSSRLPRWRCVIAALAFAVLPITGFALSWEAGADAQAFSSGDFKAVKRAIQRDADLYKDPRIILEALPTGISSGNVEMVRYLASLGWLEVCRQAERCYPLHTAASYGHIEIIKFLMLKGFDVKAIVEGETALHDAARGGHLDTVKFLVAQGADTTAQDAYKSTALGMAMGSFRSLKSANLAKVIEYLADKDDTLRLKALPLLISAANPDFIKRVAAKGWLKTCRQSKACYPIHDAAFAGSPDTIRVLMSAGFDVRGIDAAGNTALHRAAHPGHQSTVAFLCAQGVDRTVVNGQGRTAVAEAKEEAAKKRFSNPEIDARRRANLAKIIVYLESGQCLKK